MTKYLKVFVLAVLVVVAIALDMQVFHRDLAVASGMMFLAGVFVAICFEMVQFFRSTGEEYGIGNIWRNAAFDSIGAVAGVVLALIGHFLM